MREDDVRGAHVGLPQEPRALRLGGVREDQKRRREQQAVDGRERAAGRGGGGGGECGGEARTGRAGLGIGLGSMRNGGGGGLRHRKLAACGAGARGGGVGSPPGRPQMFSTAYRLCKSLRIGGGTDHERAMARSHRDLCPRSSVV